MWYKDANGRPYLKEVARVEALKRLDDSLVELTLTSGPKYAKKWEIMLGSEDGDQFVVGYTATIHLYPNHREPDGSKRTTELVPFVPFENKALSPVHSERYGGNASRN